jgi:hypothetical protein
VVGGATVAVVMADLPSYKERGMLLRKAKIIPFVDKTVGGASFFLNKQIETS